MLSVRSEGAPARPRADLAEARELHRDAAAPAARTRSPSWLRHGGGRRSSSGRARARGAAAWRPRAPASDAVGAAGAAARLPPCPSGTTLPCPRPRVGSACGRRVSRSAGCGYGSGPTVVALRSPPRRLRHPARLLGRPDRAVLRSARGRGRRGAPRVVARGPGRARPIHGRSLVALDGDDVIARVEALPQVAHASYDLSFHQTLFVRVTRRSGGRSCDAGRRRGWCRRADASSEGFLAARTRDCRASGSRRRSPFGSARSSRTRPRCAVGPPALKKEPLPLTVYSVEARRLSSFASRGNRAPPRRNDRPRAQARSRTPRPRGRRTLDPGQRLFLDVSVSDRPVAGSTLNSEVENEG